jgi:hypothetical protein
MEVQRSEHAPQVRGNACGESAPSLNVKTGVKSDEVGSEAQVRQTVGSSSQADCLMRNSAMDDSIGGS